MEEVTGRTVGDVPPGTNEVKLGNNIVPLTEGDPVTLEDPVSKSNDQCSSQVISPAGELILPDACL